MLTGDWVYLPFCFVTWASAAAVGPVGAAHL